MMEEKGDFRHREIWLVTVTSRWYPDIGRSAAKVKNNAFRSRVVERTIRKIKSETKVPGRSVSKRGAVATISNNAREPAQN